MAMPNTTETRCTDGSVQARQVVTSNPIPTSFFITGSSSVSLAMRLLGASMCSKKKV